MAKAPSRRTVMKAFGLWLDYAEWKGRVQAGIEDPPEGEDVSDMARSVVSLHHDYQDLAEAYLKERKTNVDRT